MKQVLIYDIASCPTSAGLTMEEVYKIYKEENVVLYNSQESYLGFPVNEPKVLNVPEGTEMKILDFSNEEDYKIIKALKDDTKE